MEIKKYSDYFSFESIRDKEENVVCYHVTMIGTVEANGVAKINQTNEQEIAFGGLTLHSQDKKIKTLLDLTNSRTYYHDYTYNEGPVNVIRYAAHGRHVEEVCKFEEGDRVLIEGRAYIRQNSIRGEGDKPELTVSVAGTFYLGKVRTQYIRNDLVPQEDMD